MADYLKMMIGRKKEIQELEKLYGSKQAELVAVYGRRRIGKTYLINQVFSDRFLLSMPVWLQKKRAIRAKRQPNN